MPRLRRAHAPGSGIHITARTQFERPWFVGDHRDAYAEIICEAAVSFKHNLLAFALMPNHFHLVVRQGDAPLGWMMQRIMQRIAARVQKHHSITGHVFGQRYWSAVCSSPTYLRRAIVYTHLNPCKAELCADPCGFRWTSHNALLSGNSPWSAYFDAQDALVLFACESPSEKHMRASYLRFVNYTIERRRSGTPGDWLLPEGPHRLFIPAARLGDLHWATTYAAYQSPKEKPETPVYDAAVAVLQRLDLHCTLDVLRSGAKTRQVVALRNKVIESLLLLGYRTGAIARCLRVSHSLVSQIKARMRHAAIPNK